MAVGCAAVWACHVIASGIRHGCLNPLSEVVDRISNSDPRVNTQRQCGSSEPCPYSEF